MHPMLAGRRTHLVVNVLETLGLVSFWIGEVWLFGFQFFTMFSINHIYVIAILIETFRISWIQKKLFFSPPNFSTKKWDHYWAHIRGGKRTDFLWCRLDFLGLPIFSFQDLPHPDLQRSPVDWKAVSSQSGKMGSFLFPQNWSPRSCWSCARRSWSPLACWDHRWSSWSWLDWAIPGGRGGRGRSRSAQRGRRSWRR